jgi:hypothetical protein
MRHLAQGFFVSLLVWLWAGNAMADRWPDDVPLLHKHGRPASASTPNCRYLKYVTNAKVKELIQEFATALEKNEWKPDEKYFYADSVNYAIGCWTKDNRKLMVSINDMIPRIEVNLTLCKPDAPCGENALASDPAATALLDAVKARYSGLKTYRDTGSQVTKFLRANDSESLSDSLNFTLAMERNGGFRFEFAKDGDNYIVYKGDDGARAYWTLTRDDKKADSLDDLTSGATGVSGNTVNMIPDLIAGEDRAFKRLRNVQSLPSETIDGVECQGIVGFDENCLPVRIFVGARDKLIRRWEEETQFPDFKTKDVNTFKPEADISLTPHDLAFDPAARLKSPKSGSLLDGITGMVGRFIMGF